MIVSNRKTSSLFLLFLAVFYIKNEAARAQEQIKDQAHTPGQAEALPRNSGPSSNSSEPGASTSGSTSQTSGSPKQSNVLDFEADVIEGERSGPSILIQMDLQAPTLDTLVFQRKNFNDFHAIDMKRKPKYRGK
jgi:hypothetical protein